MAKNVVMLEDKVARKIAELVELVEAHPAQRPRTNIRVTSRHWGPSSKRAGLLGRNA